MSPTGLHINPDLKGIAERQVSGGGFRPAGGARKPVTTVRSKALHNLQLRATVEGHAFVADEGLSKGGHDAGPAPMRYFLAGLMMCHQVWCIKGAALRDLPLASLEGEISAFVGPAAGNSSGAARVLDRFSFSVFVESDAPTPDVVAVVDAAADLCPAFGTVSASAHIDLVLHHNGEVVFEKAYGSAEDS